MVLTMLSMAVLAAAVRDLVRLSFQENTVREYMNEFPYRAKHGRIELTKVARKSYLSQIIIACCLKKKALN